MKKKRHNILSPREGIVNRNDIDRLINNILFKPRYKITEKK